MNRRCVFFGDEVLTVQCADLARDAGLEVAAVVSTLPYASTWAGDRSIPLLEPRVDLLSALRELDFDVLFSVAFLRLIADDVLDLATVAINFHDGPLPGYAGLNTPNWAILAGETEHGITWHLIDSGIDTGDIVLAETFPIEPDDTAFSLNARCYEKALETFPVVAAAVAGGDLIARPQPHHGRRLFTRDQRPAGASLFDPRCPAAEAERLHRAVDVGPQRRHHLGALRLLLDGEAHLVTGCRVEPSRGGSAGTASLGAELRIATVDGDLVVTDLVDTSGAAVDPVALAERHGLVDGARWPAPPEGLATGFDNADPRLARSEGRTASRLAALVPTQLVDLGLDAAADGADVDSSHRLVAPALHAARVALPPDCETDLALAVCATWLARRSTQGQAVVELVTPRLVEELVGLAPLARPPLVALGPLGDETIGELVPTVRAAVDGAAEEGIWLADLVARDPELRRDPPDEPAVRLAVGGDAPQAGAGLCLTVRGSSIEIGTGLAGIDQGEIDRLADEIRALLDAAVEGCMRPARSLPIVSGADLDLLRALNDTQRPHDSSVTVDQLFRDRVAIHPEAAAISSSGRQLSYAELASLVDRFSAQLRESGVGHGARVGIALPRGIDMVVAVLAVLDCGAAYVPLDPEYPPDRLAFMVSDAGLIAVVAADPHIPWLGAGAVPVVVPGITGVAERPIAPRDHGGDDLAYVIYTSGSTGTPKGVMLEHRQVANFFLAMDEVIDHETPGVWLAVTSLSFDISVLELLWTLTRGFHVVVRPDAPMPSAAVGADRRGCPGFSLFYFAASEATDADGYRLLLEGASFADANGFEAVWIPERHFHEFGGIYPNPSVLAAAVAARTENVAIRAGSCVVPLHHPARIAEEWAVVDNISGGRVGIAAAAGWQPNDFVLNPENYAESKQVMLDSLEVVRRLWRGESVPMEGPKGPVDVRTLPRPVQAELPLWITSAGNVETFEVAGRAGHRLLTHLLGQSIDQLAVKVAAYRAAWRAAGHEGDGHVTLMLHTYLDDDRDRSRERARPFLRQYLRSATGLLKDMASSFPTLRGAGRDADEMFASLGEDELEGLLDAAVDRYLGTSGLFGDLDDAVGMVERVTAAGADEVACLVDFGVATDDVLAALPLIARLKERSEERIGFGDEETETAPAVEGPASVGTLIRRHGCTHLQCTPSLATMLAADPDDRAALGLIEHMLVGGEALPTALAEDLRAILPGRLTNMYGPTETTIWSLVHEIEEVDSGPVPIGRPIANTTIAVFDEHGEPLPVGCHGELHIGGAGVARGYHDRPSLTAERFVERAGHGRMYATGDVVRVLQSGVVEFGGRSDFQIKVRGHRIELGEIEAVLDRHPDVARAVVTASDADSGVRLVAYVLPAQGATVDTDALRSHLADRLPEVMVPASWVVLEDLPLTPNRKIDRKALPEPRDHLVQRPLTAPAAGRREEMVASIWEEALGHGVGREDNFFDVGGHSLLAVKIFRELTDTTGLDLALTDVFRYPTVKAFADHLESLEDQTTAGGESRRDDDAGRSTGSDRGALRRRARRGRSD